MSKKELIKRYSLFLFSVLINGFGIAVITFANVGTTPISSSNYVTVSTLRTDSRTINFIFNVLLIIAQYLLLNKQERKQQIYNIIMQVPITVPFCLAIDLGMFILRNFLPEEFAYPFHPGTTYNRNMCFSFRHYFSGYCRRFYGLWRIFRKNSSSKN